MAFPYQIGSRGPDITRWQLWFQKMYRSYAPSADGVYDEQDAAATRELQRRLGLPQTGVFDAATARKSGYPAPRHLALVYRGTGGVIGEDLVSLVCQQVSDLVEEINPVYPAAMGGIPVGTATDVSGMSMDKGCLMGFENGKKEFLKRYAVNPGIKVVVGGYSQGAVPAAMLRKWLLQNYADNYLCSFSFGDPTRPVGGCYFAGDPTPGRGISSWRYGDVHDWRHCWLAHPGDMYTSVPDGPVGDIMDTAYDMVTKTQLSDPLTSAKAILVNIPVILREAGVDVPGAFWALSKGPAGLVSWVIPLLIGALQGLISELVGMPDSDKAGTAAAAEAAVIALKFVADQPPTRCHISYHIDEVWPGMTYLGLAAQHVRHYANTVSPS